MMRRACDVFICGYSARVGAYRHDTVGDTVVGAADRPELLRQNTA